MTGSSSDRSPFPGNGPDPSGPGNTKRQQLVRAVRFWKLSISDIWLHYFSLGGTVGEYELDAYVNASYQLSALQHDIAAQAVNELIDRMPKPPRAAYSDEADIETDSDHDDG